MIVHGTVRAAPAALLVAALLLAATPAREARAADRDAVSCEFGDLTRRVTLRARADAERVCDVLYEKPDEGGTSEVLWSARHDPDFCEPKYERFVRQLASQGWRCARAEEPGGSDVRGRLRDWCVAEAGEGAEQVERYCNCVASDMARYGITANDARAIVDGLPPPFRMRGGTLASDVERRGRLNTLAVNYEYVVDACR